MNKSKKLVIFSSVCVILLVALIGGTLAWFYINDEVTVDYGSSIFCEAGDSLEISLVEDNTAKKWSSSIDYSAGEYTTVDISGNGYNLYRPIEIDENQQPDGFINAVSSLENSDTFDYVEMEVAFRSLSKMNVYLSDESFIEPADPTDNSSNIYGNFSRDYIAGAMRVAVVDDTELKMLWAPNSHYQLIQYPNGTYDFRTGDLNNSVPETSYSYFAEGEEGEMVQTPVTAEDYATKTFGVDSTGATKDTSGNAPVLVSLNPAAEGEYAEETVRIRIWFEGTDREAHQALAGGNVKVKLKFVGIHKEDAEAEKQTALESLSFNSETGTVSGMADGMVFTTDGQNWKEYTSSAPNLPTLESGASIFIKYPETDNNYESTLVKFTKD